MIKLCKNLFYKPKYGNDTDSLMLKHLFSTVATVLVCLAAISFSAYAFFSHSVTSGTNKIQASTFSASVTIQKDDTLVIQGDIQSYLFDAPGKYTVVVTTSSNTTGTGFYIVHVGGAKYYTQQLGKDVSAPNQERTEIRFILDVKVASTVTFESRWGTNSYYNASSGNEFYITNLQVIVVDPAQGAADNTEETTPEESTPEETTPTTNSDGTVHIVQSGESLATIAEKYGTTHQSLAEYNQLENPRLIQPGQEIRIPTEQVE